MINLRKCKRGLIYLAVKFYIKNNLKRAKATSY